MRRSFRADLIVDTPPVKIIKNPKRKTVCRKNPRFEKLLKDWIVEAGDRYCVENLAKRAVVQRQTVHKWIKGHQAGKYSLWPIASYFGEILQKPRKQLYKEITHICIEF